MSQRGARSGAEARSLVRLVPWYTAGLAGLSVLFVALAPVGKAPSVAAWVAAACLLPLLTAAGTLELEFQYRDDVEAIDLFEAMLTPVVFAFPPAAAVAFAGVAKAVSQGLLHVERRKASFNTAQWMCATAAGSLVLREIRPGAGSDGNGLDALALAFVCVLAVNLVAFVGVLRLAGTRTLHAVIADLRRGFVRAWLLGGSVNLALGMLFAAAFGRTPWAAPVFLVPLALLHWASHGYAEVRVDRARLAGLQHATHALAQPVNPRDAIGAFLREVRACFEADTAEVVLASGERLVCHRLSGSGPGSCRVDALSPDDRPLAQSLMERGQLVRVDAGNPDITLAAALRIEGWRNCLAAPVRADGHVIGVLCTYNRSGIQGGFEHGELAVLDALACELSRALERSQLLEQVLEERGKLAEIIGRTSDGIATIAADGTVTSWNPAMEAITGYRASATIGTYRLGTLRPRDANGNDILLERWLDQDALPSVVRILTATGETRWLSCSWTRISGSAGTDADAEVACILVARDVTEGHKLERIKQEFVATVSHELRTPLAPILGWATTLLTRGDRLPEKDRRNGLEAILRQGQRLERLIVNLLEVSKIEAGAGSDGNREIHVATIARGVIDELRAAWPQRVIELELPDHPCMAIGNDVWVEQIITNLVSNAIKYAPPPAPIVLRLRALAGELEVSVVDQGPGIPLEEQQHIFGRFERYAHADTQPGTGLGLYISRQLADAMGADLHVTSRVGEGATFSLCLRAPVQLVAVS